MLKNQFIKEMVDSSVQEGKSISCRLIASRLDISTSLTWRILKKNLGYKPYKPKTIVPLTPAHKLERVSICNWPLLQDLKFAELCLWSDKKWFVVKQALNKQNERYWSLQDEEIEVECRVQRGEKVMCWCGILDGKIIIHWFEDGVSVNGISYLEMLKTVVWPKIRSKVNSKPNLSHLCRMALPFIGGLKYWIG